MATASFFNTSKMIEVMASLAASVRSFFPTIYAFPSLCPIWMTTSNSFTSRRTLFPPRPMIRPANLSSNQRRTILFLFIPEVLQDVFLCGRHLFSRWSFQNHFDLILSWWLYQNTNVVGGGFDPPRVQSILYDSVANQLGKNGEFFLISSSLPLFDQRFYVLLSRFSLFAHSWPLRLLGWLFRRYAPHA